jgi:hydrogenase small subunit
MPFMDEPPGAKLSSRGSTVYGKAVRRLRKVTERTLDKEPSWRTKGRELKTGFQKTW